MEHVSDSFKAESECGERFTVLRLRPLIETRNLSGSSSVLGMPRLVLTDGTEVTTTNDPEEFKIVSTDKIIRKAD